MATAEALKLVGKIPVKVKYLISGYNKRIVNNSSVIIAPLIQSLCLLYYYQMDYFEKAHENYKISQDKLTVTLERGGGSWNTWAVCNEWINSMSNAIIKWTFHIQQPTKSGSGICFALTSKDNGVFFRYASSDGDTYVHCNSGITYGNKKKIHDIPSTKSGKYRVFGHDDIVLYILDLKKGVLRCKIKGKKQWTITKVKRSKDVRYKMIVVMIFAGDSITLKDYSWSFA